jgi:hypothetical protein
MRFAGLAVVTAFVVLCSTSLSPGQQEAAGAQAPAVGNAQAYVKMMVTHASSPDPKLRFSVREGLRIMGPQAISALEEAKKTITSKHVKAFIDRTVKRIRDGIQAEQAAAQAAQNAQQGRRMPFGRGGREIDIDRIAMDLNLTWEQMEKVEPVLVKARKEMDELMKVFQESGGFRDREAFADLQAEMKTISDAAKPELLKALSAAQVARLERQLNPFGRMGRMGDRRGGQRGQGGGRRPGGGGG